MRKIWRQQHQQKIIKQIVPPLRPSTSTPSDYGTLKRQNIFPVTVPRKKALLKKIMSFIAFDDQPILVVEDVGFQRLIEVSGLMHMEHHA